MWQAMKLDSASGTWSEIGRNSDLISCKGLVGSQTGEIYYFWAAQPPSSHEEQNRIVEQVMAANDGRILRVGIGVEVSISKDENIATCPGRCFCVIANGMRRCETQYCNENWCWWVPCGMNC